MSEGNIEIQESEIKSTPNFVKHGREVSFKENIKKYKERERERRQEFFAKQKNKAQIRKLGRYAEWNFGDHYSGDDYEIVEIFNTIRGDRIEEIRYDDKSKALLKAKSYDYAVEQNKHKKIDFYGFENDSDIPDAKKFIYRAFGKKLLQKCLVSKVRYVSDKIFVCINDIDYRLPVHVYMEWEKRMPEVKSVRFRAESFAPAMADINFSQKFMPTPIYLYSFYGEQPDRLNYLEDISLEKKMRLYKLSAISHEFAHHIYDYLMNADSLRVWRELVDRSVPITDYVKSFSNSKLKYNEFFAEAVRLKTIVPNYLKNKFPEFDQFLTDKFPDINSKKKPFN